VRDFAGCYNEMKMMMVKVRDWGIAGKVKD
jgi:hypothetical protein